MPYQKKIRHLIEIVWISADKIFRRIKSSVKSQIFGSYVYRNVVRYGNIYQESNPPV